VHCFIAIELRWRLRLAAFQLRPQTAETCINAVPRLDGPP
jgi:hypothetical protein